MNIKLETKLKKIEFGKCSFLVYLGFSAFRFAWEDHLPKM
ncbi:unnamed protein product [Amoebophrya sp. A25]|nr:unnamed protein product [Amoebophrya sp. A25]|eukprot:GSA25T00022151001.1